MARNEDFAILKNVCLSDCKTKLTCITAETLLTEFSKNSSDSVSELRVIGSIHSTSNFAGGSSREVNLSHHLPGNISSTLLIAPYILERSVYILSSLITLKAGLSLVVLNAENCPRSSKAERQLQPVCKSVIVSLNRMLKHPKSKAKKLLGFILTVSIMKNADIR